MDKTLEEKLNEINNNVLEIKQDLAIVKKDLRGFIDFSNERSTKIEDSIAASKEEILREVQKTKLEAVDKYIKVDKFDNHETRIQALESKTA